MLSSTSLYYIFLSLGCTNPSWAINYMLTRFLEVPLLSDASAMECSDPLLASLIQRLRPRGSLRQSALPSTSSHLSFSSVLNFVFHAVISPIYLSMPIPPLPYQISKNTFIHLQRPDCLNTLAPVPAWCTRPLWHKNLPTELIWCFIKFILNPIGL